MPKLQNPQRIIVEDFAKEDQELVERLSTVINNHMENVFNILNSNVDFANLKQEKVTIKVAVDANGTPTKTTQFSSVLFSNAIDCIVVYARNKTNPTTYPTSMPLVSFNPQGGGIYKVLNVAGLPVGDTFEIHLVLIP